MHEPSAHPKYPSDGRMVMIGLVIAVIFHFWLGLILLLAGGAAIVGLIGGYLKTVSGAKYPNGKQKREG
ncbi:MAG: hypothetical protein JWM34_3175 [Ilumatobacteraceae bacterium]|nr:hypothetical protein [Ilumatobacteraceae bacterium]